MPRFNDEEDDSEELYESDFENESYKQEEEDDEGGNNYYMDYESKYSKNSAKKVKKLEAPKKREE